MSSQTVNSTFASSSDDRKEAQPPFSGYDYQGFRLGLMDVISAWLISAVIIAVLFALF